MGAVLKNPIIQAALWMVIFCAFMSLLSVLLRTMYNDYPVIELVFFRNLFSLLFIAPFALRAGWGALRTKRLKTHMLRAVSGSLAMFCLFTGVGLLPLADFTALTFTAPLFATLGAALFLRERVRLHRGSALIVGFIGALVIIRPGDGLLEWGAVFALAGAFFMATTMLIVKSLSGDDKPATIVFYMGVLMTPMSLVVAFPVWIWPSWEHMPWLIAIGVVAGIGQIAMTKAMSLAQASIVTPFNFMQMIFATAFGYALYDEHLDFYTLLGSVIVFAATVYITIREARKRKISA